MAITNKTKIISVVCVLVVLGGAALAERVCGSPYTAVQQTTLDRLHAIVAYSGGDWEKVTPADKKFFIDGPGFGSEGRARMTFGSLAAQQKQANVSK